MTGIRLNQERFAEQGLAVAPEATSALEGASP